MNYRIRHTSRYHYSAPVTLCWNEACLLLRDTPQQRCLASALQVTPAPADQSERYDYFGNRISHFVIQEPHQELVVTATSRVSVCPPSGDLLAATNRESWESVAATLRNDRSKATLEALPFLYDSPFIKLSQKLADYARPSFSEGETLLEAVGDLMRRIYQEFTYDPGFTSLATPLATVLRQRRGVCQDFAHLGVGCLRAMGLAARYVSGYIETLPPPGQEKLVGADASHAWFAVYSPAAGWLDFDPTNNQLPHEQHITVAWGRDYADVSPLKGVAQGGGKHQVEVAVDVAREPDIID